METPIKIPSQEVVRIKQKAQLFLKQTEFITIFKQQKS